MDEEVGKPDGSGTDHQSSPQPQIGKKQPERILPRNVEKRDPRRKHKIQGIPKMQLQTLEGDHKNPNEECYKPQGDRGLAVPKRRRSQMKVPLREGHNNRGTPDGKMRHHEPHQSRPIQNQGPDCLAGMARLLAGRAEEGTPKIHGNIIEPGTNRSGRNQPTDLPTDKEGKTPQDEDVRTLLQER
ncbi:hypothetical protein L873DRAFT_1787780 [Choiromyces venosus 120613-1]|uniref:Uncharacterized protein n=1 Tax=Choiromyces venosus 120613-1 TaxID=1336337 RepID=A0A3N4JVQ7_9PEZI|nr:hypothetical protein L873DRAFT_1787780 [Choiromyces venosus 120613-1]